MKNEVDKEYTLSLRVRKEDQEPSLYQVVLENDDFTPMEFVVGVLETFFYMSRRQATSIMLEAHTKGTAICGLYSRDLAESKISQVVDYARMHDHPLRYRMEAA